MWFSGIYQEGMLPWTEVGTISAANKVPPTLTPKMIEENILDDEDDKKYNVSWHKWTCQILNQNRSK